MKAIALRGEFRREIESPCGDAARRIR